MRRSMVALGAALVLSLAPMPASADSGMFNMDDGPSCSWFGSGGMYNIDCSGFSRSAQGYVNYSCDYYSYGGGSVSWRCRDRNGNTWSGSR